MEPSKEIEVNGYKYKLMTDKRYRCNTCSSIYNSSTSSKSSHSNSCRSMKPKNENNDHMETFSRLDSIPDWRKVLTPDFKRKMTSFGTTKKSEKYYFTFKSNNNNFFVKSLPKGNDFNFSLIYDEISIATKYSHPNLMKTYTFFEDLNFVYIVSEKFGVSLNHSRKDQAIKKIFMQITEGLMFLHENDIIHRDLKPGNILIKNDNAKIADFGQSVCSVDKAEKLGTKYYWAPEPYSTRKSDIWSLGCILLYMINPKSIENTVFLANKQEFIDSAVKESKLNKLISSILNETPEKRPGCKEILNDEYFQDKDDNLPNKKLNL
jgi:hypothetical protein